VTVLVENHYTKQFLLQAEKLAPSCWGCWSDDQARRCLQKMRITGHRSSSGPTNVCICPMYSNY